MRVWHVDSAGAKLDVLGRGRDPGEERNAGSDVLGLIGHVLADIGFAKSEFVGEQEGLAVFFQRESPILFERMDRHRKETQVHLPAPLAGVLSAGERAWFAISRQVQKSNLP